MSETPRIPMALAISNLSEIMGAIDDEQGDINETLVRLFDESRLTVAATVDRRVLFFDVAKAQLDRLKELSAIYSLSAKKLQKTIEWVEENTKKLMAEIPEYKYCGDLGELKIQENPAALKIAVETKTTSVSNIIDESAIHQWKLPQEYLVRREFYCLNNEAIKTDLKNGKELAWAGLTKGTRLKILRK